MLAKTVKLPPLSLYIHLPWCIKKCPYCDFNSHTLVKELQETYYIKRLITDLQQHLDNVAERPIQSIFFGGGTPSLFSGHAITQLLTQLRTLLPFAPDIEITLEANPATVERQFIAEYADAGVNRLSLGIQSFQADKLTALGRIHTHQDAISAIEMAIKHQFSHINIDIMHGLPQQTVEDALYDLQMATQYPIDHLSWYQLTIEPNTYFYQHPPTLPKELVLADIEKQGLALLKDSGFDRYEVSAFCRHNHRCLHNCQYWTFGDYIGIGAGAHGKLTTQSGIYRYRNVKHPEKYLSKDHPILFEKKYIPSDQLAFEFMLNVLRLYEAIPYQLFEQRTGLSIQLIEKPLAKGESLGLLTRQNQTIVTTDLGKRYLNDVVLLFSR